MLLAILIIITCPKVTAQNADDNQTKSITVLLKENNHKSIGDRVAIYEAYKKKYPNKKLEDDVNLYGYSLLWDGKVKEAIEIFKLLVRDYPSSANTYDSLGEAFLADNNKKLALEYYQKSLSIDPDNFNAEDQIDRILSPNKKVLNPSDKFEIKYTARDYREDLDQLVSTLLKVHPNALKFISQKELSNLLEKKKNAISDNTTYAEFAWHCSEIVANINCSHTGTGGFYPEYEMLPKHLQFPLHTRLIDNQLYIIDPLNNAEHLTTQDEIVMINGMHVNEIINNIFRHIPSQGLVTTSKRHEFNRWSFGMIPYSLGFPKEYFVHIKGKEEPIQLSKAEFKFRPIKDQSKIYCGDNLCLEFLDTDKKIALLTISSFNYYEWNNFKQFQRFIDESMKDFKTYETEHVIIDVRDNGGGSPESSIHLLKYLIHEPFVYTSVAEFEGKTELTMGEKLQIPFENGYDGKLLFLIDGVGNSTTGHFMSIVKDRNLGIIIGEELGSNHFCSAGRKPCRLKNTKLNFSVANNTHISTANSYPDDQGILPDHYVTQSIDEYLNGIDAVKEFAIAHIKKEKTWISSSKYHSSYFLNSDPSWDKELFRIPLNFAPQITLRGIEDARFPKGWNKVDNPNFWSYVFAWNVDHPQLLTTEEISTNLELYFNGLMNIEKRGKAVGVSESVGRFEVTNTEHGVTSYLGEIKTMDGFFTKQPLTFNVLAEQQYCEEAKRAIVIFRFSPQPITSTVWDTLKKVTVPQNICNK